MFSLGQNIRKMSQPPEILLKFWEQWESSGNTATESMMAWCDVAECAARFVIFLAYPDVFYSTKSTAVCPKMFSF